MKFEIPKDKLIKPLQQIAGVVERKQTMHVLNNILIRLDSQTNQLLLTGSDLEIEMVADITLEGQFDSGEVTIPARKLLDICKSLPDGSNVTVKQNENKAILSSGPSNKYSLSTLPANEFPDIEKGKPLFEFTVAQKVLKRLIDKTAFCIAQQDVRFYLNGLMFEVRSHSIRTVASDGHRLSTCIAEVATTDTITDAYQIIIPRKGVAELQKIISDSEEPITITIGSNYISAKMEQYQFTSKLVDAKFPDYTRVIPNNCDLTVNAHRDLLRQALSRAAILANEKYKGVWFELTENNLQIRANNPEHEEAEEQLEVEFPFEKLEVGFNVAYLLEVLAALDDELVDIRLSSKGGSSIIKGHEATDSLYVVMPMKL